MYPLGGPEDIDGDIRQRAIDAIETEKVLDWVDGAQ